jgi:hypothetical protein
MRHGNVCVSPVDEWHLDYDIIRYFKNGFFWFFDIKMEYDKFINMVKLIYKNLSLRGEL